MSADSLPPHRPSLVSVVTAFLDEERFLGEAIESVLAQSYPFWELFLVDDGSSDGSSRMARDFASSQPERIHYLEHPGHTNRGLPASRNVGIRNSRGDYLAFLDADDVWLPGKLEEQVAVLDSHPAVGMVYGQSVYWRSWARGVGPSEDLIPILGVAPNQVIRPPELIPLYLGGRAAVPPPCSVLVRRSVVEAVGGFQEDLPEGAHIYEDQTFYCKVCLEHPVVTVPVVWDRYRLHETSMMAAAARAGQTHRTRVWFLGWVADYLRRKGRRDAQVWRALHKDLWLKTTPSWLPETGRVPWIVRWKKKWLLRFAEHMMPRAWWDRLWSRPRGASRSVLSPGDHRDRVSEEEGRQRIEGRDSP